MFNGRRTTHMIVLGTTAVVAAAGITAATYGIAGDATSTAIDPTPVVASSSNADTVAVVAATQDLDQAEADGIAFMREEEKLARDVYLALADTWSLRVFSNIARAEQTHMDAVLGLMDTYGLDDPVGDNDIGEFMDPELQQMFDDLVASGSESVESALKVGALIEEVDIEDLVVYLEATVPTDVATVYKRLLSGSENHLRAFVSQLQREGVDYQPIVLDADFYDSILSSESKRGGHQNEQGSGHGAGRGGRNA